MKSSFLFFLCIIGILLTSGCGVIDFSEKYGASNTRAHSLGIKQSVVTKPHGTLSLQVEFSDMSYIDQITDEWHYVDWWEFENEPYVTNVLSQLKRQVKIRKAYPWK